MISRRESQEIVNFVNKLVNERLFAFVTDGKIDFGKTSVGNVTGTQYSGGQISNDAIWNRHVHPNANIDGTKIKIATTIIRGTVELATNGESAAGVVVQGNDSRLSALDTHTKNIWEVLRTGEYYSFTNTPANIGVTLVADTLYAQPFVVVRDVTIDRIAIDVKTAVGGSNCRLGIYNLGTNLYPGALLLDAGVVSTAAAGVKTITISQTLPKGIYFLAVVSDDTPALYGAGGNVTTDVAPMGMLAAGFRYNNYMWSVAHTYAALPDPFTGGGALNTNYLRQAVRILSLD